MKLPVIPYPQQVRQLDGVYRLPEGGIHVTYRQDDTIAPEGYRLTVGAGILIEHADRDGKLNAERTLRQIVRHCAGGEIPCCEIHDAPRCRHRGFMLDCVRHFFTVEEIKRMIDAMAMFKMNVFHWHLTDDQGWRIQIDRYPLLTEVGSKRPYSDFGRDYEPGEYGGVYTKDDVREIVAYCEERCVEVIPEIEFPGHATSILAAYPDLSCDGHPVQVSTRGGVHTNTICVSSEKTMEFVKNVLSEVVELFPGKRIHLGGDEAPKDHWMNCPHCQEYMKAHGLKNALELQCDFTNRVAEFLKQYGKTAIVWSDSIKGHNLSPEVTSQYWVGDIDLTAEHLNKGGRTIMSTCGTFYLDMSYGQTAVSTTYKGFEAIPGVLPECEAGILGIETPLWTEFIQNFDRLAFQAFPRAAAAAERAWSPAEIRDVDDFKARFKLLSADLVELGVVPAPEKLWDMSKPKRIWDALKYWHHAMTRDDIQKFIAQMKRERKEAEYEREN